MFNMIPPEMHSDTRQPYALTFDPGYVYGPNKSSKLLGCDIL
jgi:hypothetical protein